MTTTVEPRKWRRVAWWRDQGVNAKWSKTRQGKPFIIFEVGGTWHGCYKDTLAQIFEYLDKGYTLREAVDGIFCLIGLFSVHRECFELPQKGNV